METVISKKPRKLLTYIFILFIHLIIQNKCPILLLVVHIEKNVKVGGRWIGNRMTTTGSDDKACERANAHRTKRETEKDPT
jgi:hypothetical protein